VLEISLKVKLVGGPREGGVVKGKGSEKKDQSAEQARGKIEEGGP